MDNQDRELMKQATKTICELNTLTDAQAQELQSAREEIEQLKANLYDAENALARCEGWRGRYWEERDQARRWAAAWKRAAKVWRDTYLGDNFWMEEARRMDAERAQMDAEIKRLRASLKWALVHARYPLPLNPGFGPSEAGRQFERGRDEAKAALEATE